MKRLTSLLLPIPLAILGACGDDDDDANTGGETLSVTFNALSDVGADLVYEGWLITADGPVSAGRFSVTEGEPYTANFDIDSSIVEEATTYVLTIEPAVGDDPAPSDIHVLAGDFASDSATLTVDHQAAIGTDFADAAGDFVLTTPTSAATDDDALGIWWVVPGSGMPPDGSLTLPALAAGWVYEGWVVSEATGPISTGRFLTASEADSDGAGPTAGTDAGGPPRPGQDFIDPAMDLTGGFTAVITVEPDSDDDPAAPYAIKPLITMPISADLAPTQQIMTNQAASTLPTGSAVKL